MFKNSNNCICAESDYFCWQLPEQNVEKLKLPKRTGITDQTEVIVPKNGEVMLQRCTTDKTDIQLTFPRCPKRRRAWAFVPFFRGVGHGPIKTIGLETVWTVGQRVFSLLYLINYVNCKLDTSLYQPPQDIQLNRNLLGCTESKWLPSCFRTRFSADAAACEITLNRPAKLNALNLEMCHGLSQWWNNTVTTLVSGLWF